MTSHCITNVNIVCVPSMFDNFWQQFTFAYLAKLLTLPVITKNRDSNLLASYNCTH